MEERKMIDCRRYANPEKCTLAISGREDEVLSAGMAHGKAVHGYPDTPDMREKMRSALLPEKPTAAEPGRKVADCSTLPSEIKCSLKISGREDEVVQAATLHAAREHKHELSPELEKAVRSSLKDERS